MSAGGEALYRCRRLFFILGGCMSEYRALYRKWRSRDFDEVYGQEGITDILKYEVKESRLSHAYLFCGSRGTGKYSVKIFSRLCEQNFVSVFIRNSFVFNYAVRMSVDKGIKTNSVGDKFF